MPRLIRMKPETWRRLEARVGGNDKADDKVGRLLDLIEKIERESGGIPIPRAVAPSGPKEG